jgi:UDP-N-acetylmuramate: L-alanyl-gamma-D-glutamyl-meso-diaminopimelate ligase
VNGIRIYEDFAHHPTAVRETLHAVRTIFHPERVWAIYEPRSATSRRNIFQREIAEALSLADFIALPELSDPKRFREENGWMRISSYKTCDMAAPPGISGMWQV